MRWCCTTLVAGVVLCGCGAPEEAARQELESQGFSGFTLTDVGDGAFTFLGFKGDRPCRGEVRVHSAGGACSSQTSSSVEWECAWPDDAADVARLCDDGNIEACLVAGDRYRLGEGVEADPARSTDLYERACDANRGSGCFYLALAFDRGRGRSYEPQFAYETYRKACDLGDEVGCYNGGVMAREGRGTPSQGVAALRLFRKGCDAGHADSCVAAASLDLEHGEPDARQRAIAYLTEGCEADRAQACSDLGLAHHLELLPSSSPEEARRLFARACELEHAHSCKNLSVLIRDSDPEEAVRLADRSCELGNAEGCAQLAYYLMNGIGTEQDDDRAGELLERACEDAVGVACFNLAALQPPDGERAGELRARACSLGYLPGCE